MTPNATVSYMATQVEQRLVEAKAARAWLMEDAAHDQTPRRTLRSLPMRLVVILTAYLDRHRGTVTNPPVSHTALGVGDLAR